MMGQFLEEVFLIFHFSLFLMTSQCGPNRVTGDGEQYMSVYKRNSTMLPEEDGCEWKEYIKTAIDDEWKTRNCFLSWYVLPDKDQVERLDPMARPSRRYLKEVEQLPPLHLGGPSEEVDQGKITEREHDKDSPTTPLSTELTISKVELVQKLSPSSPTTYLTIVITRGFGVEQLSGGG